MKNISFKKALELFGGTNIEVYNNYNYRTAFFDKDGQCMYARTGDLRMPLKVLIRTAKNRRDFAGGSNTFPLESFLAERGYKLQINFLKCDFNRN